MEDGDATRSCMLKVNVCDIDISITDILNFSKNFSAAQWWIQQRVWQSTVRRQYNACAIEIVRGKRRCCKH